MNLLLPLYAWIAVNFIGMGIAFYVDRRTDLRFRTGDLPAPIRLLGWFQPGINPFILFSSTFRRAQDSSTRWAVLPLRLIMGANIVLAIAFFGGLAFLVGRDPG